ncbi:lysine--tRNA ligase [Candidatus Microgenomates bacterium]|nr:lysine--tRNA ligase [Candidatus Microgenomates bacterium]
MPTLKEYRDARLAKLGRLTKLGIDAYPARTARTDVAADVTKVFSKLQDSTVILAGRIAAIRQHGQLVFFDLKDASGQAQIVAKADGLKAEYAQGKLGFADLELLDTGDFVEATGKVIKTKAGEPSVEAVAMRLLTKALRPIPEQLTDKETRLRRRYLDTNINEDVRQRFLRRSQFWQANRDFLNSHGFTEINIPVLEHTTGGADAKPFKTHMDALDQDYYLRISHELPLKRLIGGGYEKVYDIGPRFRNENYTEEHLPEHVALEYYWAYADWRQGMKFTQALFQHVYQQVYGKLQFKIHEFAIDLGGQWAELDYATIMGKHYGLDVGKTDLKEVKALLTKHKLTVEKTDNLNRGIDKLWKELRKSIGGPAFLVNVPKFISPLAKSSPDNPAVTERFQPIIGGTEFGNGWSELNDPQEQLARFREQQGMRDAGDEEAQMLDIDYVEMLEYGMPPTFGWGHSERAFWMVEGVTAREGVPFAHMRHEIDDVTKSIYPDLFQS